jgi:hypothetical protein
MVINIWVYFDVKKKGFYCGQIKISIGRDTVNRNKNIDS